MEAEVIIFLVSVFILNFLCLCAVIYLIYNRTFPPYKPNRPTKNPPKDKLSNSWQFPMMKNEPKKRTIIRTDQELWEAYNEHRRDHSGGFGH